MGQEIGQELELQPERLGNTGPWLSSKNVGGANAEYFDSNGFMNQSHLVP